MEDQSWKNTFLSKHKMRKCILLRTVCEFKRYCQQQHNEPLKMKLRFFNQTLALKSELR